MALTKPDDPRRTDPDQPGSEPRGMKLLRVWVPDPAAPGFQVEAKRQAALMRGAAEEEEAMRFIAATVEWPDARGAAI
ncbi:antitoxin MazE-like protein [Methylobacterium radiodurans]|uniref:DUF3018 family protein n=1 Tax=Methylobacterium radiodurans TaxID=2202828 RepID=A0A2U8W142_9HYPH|nr:antitoxin MazE-like protein [Methylobacterium radiodurans]AWN38966.1 hypothetical protein DK427_11625 [Methylobacterium radiodurans]